MSERNIDLELALDLDRRRTEALAKAVGLLTTLQHGEGVSDPEVENLLTDCIVALGIEDQDDPTLCAEDLVKHPESGVLADRILQHGVSGARIDRLQYSEIVQAARWSDEDSGTNHFVPGLGFVVDDPDGLFVPQRWLPYLDLIEQALAALDHVAPHPLDVDTLEYLEREGKEATLWDSAAHCFVCGEHTPMTAMARSSRELWIAHRFLNEYFEGWAFHADAGFEASAQ